MSEDSPFQDYIDNHVTLSNRQKPVRKEHLLAGDTTDKQKIELHDHNNTVIFCSTHKDPEEVRRQYKEHLGLK